MAESAANADGGTSRRSNPAKAEILLTAVVARRKRDGKLVLIGQRKRSGQLTEVELDESSDHALDLYASLKKTRGILGRYTAATLFLRASTHRRAKFT